MATTNQTASEEIPRHLEGVNGWLLFFCVTTAILAPILNVSAAFRSDSLVASAIDLLFAVFAAVTGGLVWKVHDKALKVVRIYLLSLMCLGGLAILGSLTVLQHKGAGAFGANLVGLLHGLRILLINILWWKYFRRSRRVKATFGENMGSLRELF